MTKPAKRKSRTMPTLDQIFEDLDEYLIPALTEKAIAGDMLAAKMLLERRPVTSADINPMMMQAVVTAVLQKAEAGDKAALRLKARHLDDRERRR